MKKQIITTDKAPAPIGPYNQAIKINKMLFVSGQIPMTNSMELIQNNLREETKQVMENLNAILKEADMNFDDVVKTSIFIDNMDNFEIINEEYGKYFRDGDEPARETVAVKTLPKNARVEISMIAHKGN
ncbi:MAG: reactive intermediate/imine deaminase [Flavobacteriaceae bacterium]|nr:reactive intermediate/imine deaminase [Flavobacteriaceae bacterium]|tara:strand:- start:457 stop:843 length:387 start_codon:yes stop_codon:yes gene_type:complete